MAKRRTQRFRADTSRAEPSTELADRDDSLTVVGIGASAGGLDACRKLLAAVPGGTGLAFILVQHLDPNHASMMVDLLAGHTGLVVRQAADGMPIERGHFYVIPPGAYLSVADGALRLSQPTARHGARMPFDFMLPSLAEQFGAHAACVILSGTGNDGSAGLRAIAAAGGLVIAQDPEEAGYDGMPRSAIATGDVALVLPAERIPAALINHSRPPAKAPQPSAQRLHDALQAALPGIIALLRDGTAHDFTHYKHGTLLRRVARRMGLTTAGTDDVELYLARLRTDQAELDLLAKDLLIHVTSFFRDARVFDLLGSQTIPELVRRQPAEQPLRVWVAACSSGEEAYSLAMLFLEAIAAEHRAIKLQVFASDIDADAILTAREGFYPAAIAADVSPARLARFFVRDGDGYRVAPELRSAVVFTVQDVLTDPPFSRLDLISCRNMLIYLRPEAQAKVIALFHFALRAGGLLLLGGAETIPGGGEGRFEEVAKVERLYRHVGRARADDLGFALSDGVRVPQRPGQGLVRPRQLSLGEMVRQLILTAYAPAAVLVNRQNECLYSMGPIDRYLRVVPGDPSSDLLAMARHNMQGRLRAALRQAGEENARLVVPGGLIAMPDGEDVAFSIAILPVIHEGEALMLVCFVDEHRQPRRPDQPGVPQETARVAELEHELEATRDELQGAIRNLELSAEEQKAINEEARSVNEEFQSTNEELLTSKEELQSLNEELTALNTQLQESLERKRTAANDLQNVLYSTNVATIFLDPEMRIRLFTPATRVLFNVIPGDVGRPLADLSSLAFDAALLADAAAVLHSLEPIEREIETHAGQWFVRRVLPYRTIDGLVEGVVVTFVDLSDRKVIADALQVAKRQAETANVAKSRFLAAASHDLRQPLQTMALLQGLLARSVAGTKAKTLVERLGETLGAMTGMLNTLLDLNQIEAGTVRAEPVDFPINDLLLRLQDEFTYLAQAHGLELRLVPCSLTVRSDPRLLEQMLRNLLSNAVKYTKRGKVLLGCRRRGAGLGIEVWDTGIGLPADELSAVFQEYHQVDNSARERGRGLGLGLSIVQQLGDLLGHRVDVRSNLGRGSVFSIAVPVPPSAAQPAQGAQPADRDPGAMQAPRPGTVLIVEDDPELRELLELLLTEDGHHAVSASDGVMALEMVSAGRVRPDLLLADFNLPNGLNGLEVATRLRAALRHPVPVVILTGDTATDTLRAIAAHDCVHMHKPVRLKDLTDTIARLLPPAAVEPPPPRPAVIARAADLPRDQADDDRPRVLVVDDDRMVAEGIRAVLQELGLVVEVFGSAEAFMDAYRPGGESCLLLDIYLPGSSGLELLHRLRQAGHAIPVVMVTGKGDIALAVQAMKAGALDFIEKPISNQQLVAAVQRALSEAHASRRLNDWHESASHHVAGLTPRQREIMTMVLAGHPSKNIAADLGISQRTVENHRAAIMKRTETRSLPALARLALAAAGGRGEAPPEEPGPARRK